MKPCRRAGSALRASRLPACFLVFATSLPLGAATANVVTDWNVASFKAAAESTVKPTYSLSGRNAALMHFAMHDALNAVSRRYDHYRVNRSSPGANAQAAVVAAGHGVTIRVYPDQAPSLDQIYNSMLASIPDGANKDEGVKLGNEVAAEIVAFRADDRFNSIKPAGEPFVSGNGPYGSGPGAWFPAPDSPHQNAQWPNASSITPLIMTNPAQFRSVLPGPPKLSSAIYARDLDEIKTLGLKASTTRTAEQTTIAKMWSDPSMYRVFNEVARNLISARGDDLWESTRTLALLNAAIVDTYLAVFEAKYHYQFWRPTMAVRGADGDGNESTASDPNWVPLLATPPFPEYPSGHSGACGAAQIILESAFGRSTPFTATSTLLPDSSRDFKNFEAAAWECVDGRMLSGAHFRFSDEDALYLGQHVSRYALRNMLSAQ